MKSTNEEIEKEAYLGILPVTGKERTYGFMDALLVLSGYCIATWSYTQGSYLATLVGFKQLLIGAFFGAVLMLMIYQLPVILSVRYGIDIWIWLRSVFGTKGVKVMTIVIILINFPWYAVCCDLFASSMNSLADPVSYKTPGRKSLGIGSLLCHTGNFNCIQRGENDYLDYQNTGSGTAFSRCYCGNCRFYFCAGGGNLGLYT